MNIIDKSTGKRYWVTARQWVSAGNGEQSVDWANGHWADITEDILLDGSFARNDQRDAWEFGGSIDDVRDYLNDWQYYNTDDERAALAEDERKKLAGTIPRRYEIVEIA